MQFISTQSTRVFLLCMTIFLDFTFVELSDSDVKSFISDNFLDRSVCDYEGLETLT